MNKKSWIISLNRLTLCMALFCIHCFVQGQSSANKLPVILVVHPVGKDSTPVAAPAIQTNFESVMQATEYINKLPQTLVIQGFPMASVDSSWMVSDTFHLQLYLGQKYNWVELFTAGIDNPALESAGYSRKQYLEKPFNMVQMQALKEKLISYYERQGYPFAAVYLDSIRLTGDKMSAILKAEKGVLYHIDSIRMFGNVKLSTKFLQRYFDIANGSIYNKQKLQEVDKKMLELLFLKPTQPSDLTMLGSGSVLNLYAEPKKSSQVNFLVGFLPASGDNNKLQVTGDLNLDLKNMFGSAEEILVKWQQLQPKSPRLNLGFSKPYVFNSPFGVNTLFELFKKDSNFLQVNAQAGIRFNLSTNQTGSLFIQWQNNTLLSGAIDTNLIKLQKSLPPNIDVSAVNTGINYEWNATNYRFNPRKGNEVNLVAVVGLKNIRQNTDITNIKDPSFNYASLYDSVKPKSYQLRLKFGAAHYFPFSKVATLKAGIQTGYYASPNIFRNELFQIGGYKLLRGFNEEGIYATQYAVFTAEYRYLVGLNSYLFAFTDIGLVKNKYQFISSNNLFTGAGLGILFETKAGLLNVSYALGKRDDLKFNIREASKLHFGYINYF